MRFRTRLLSAGKTALGFEVPPEIVEGLGSGKRPPVLVTMNGFTYRNTVAVMGGVYMIGVSAQNRAGAGVGPGDTVDIDVELDSAPRVVTPPPDLAAALDKDTAVRQAFDAQSYSNRKAQVDLVEGAKADETRQRRIEKVVTTLRDGKR